MGAMNPALQHHVWQTQSKAKSSDNLGQDTVGGRIVHATKRPCIRDTKKVPNVENSVWAHHTKKNDSRRGGAFLGRLVLMLCHSREQVLHVQRSYHEGRKPTLLTSKTPIAEKL